MTLCESLKSKVDYARKLVNSGLDGASVGRDEYLHGPAGPFLKEAARDALKPAAVGVCVGVAGSFRGRRNSAARLFACALVGGAAGFAVGLAWRGRRLAESVASGAMKGIHHERDEHWLERHPIDYA